MAVFSMEMGASQLAVRIVGSIGRINQSHLRNGKLTDDEWPRLSEAIEKLRNEFGTIWEISNLSLRLNMAAKNIGMCYVDQRVLQANAVCADFVPLQGLAFSHIDLTFGLYFRKRRLLSTGARQFIDICNSFSFDTPQARKPSR